MTKDDNMNLLLNGSCCDNTQQQPPFHIVLVDIQAAARLREIHCVKIPLVPDQDMKYVALSYRWGELSELIVDTELGYDASITSFDLSDFCTLCDMMAQERDLCKMKYAWVDAISVNQTNYEQRKATIHHMSTIYQCANYIVAVPDLHLAYLEKITATRNLMRYANRIGDYMYHLLHGNFEQLIQLDLLNSQHDDRPPFLQPLDSIKSKLTGDNGKWYHGIKLRNQRLPELGHLLEDLVKDWSSRVWVISEYHIAKNKKNKKMKYWFLQLGSVYGLKGSVTFFEFDFANPSIPLMSPSKREEMARYAKKSTALSESMKIALDVCTSFHTTMIHQLAQQNFLEMMLKSMASKNEDRFYAVFPVSKYKREVESKDVVDSWNITTIPSVRLKLFELMDTTDKLALLYFSYNQKSVSHIQSLPTFATTKIDWNQHVHGRYQMLLLEEGEDDTFSNKDWNFDITTSSNKSVLMLMPPKEKNGLYKLHLMPKEYYLKKSDLDTSPSSAIRRWQTSAIAKRLELHHAAVPLTLAAIPFYFQRTRWSVDDLMKRDLEILLIGSLERNRWAFAPKYVYSEEGNTINNTVRLCSDNSNIGFYIY